MNIRYEIDDNDNFAIRLWDLDNPNENNEPFMYQPHFPNGDVWESHDEAESWAQAKVLEMTDESAPFAPAGRGWEPQPKPTPEEIRVMKLERLGLTVEDLKALLGL